MRRTGAGDYEEYHDHLADDPDEQEAILDALSINVTGFFRNPDVWEGVSDVLETLAEERSQVRAWSAACADGREPYSLSMLAADTRSVDEDTVSILATDINDKALTVARDGCYENTRTIDIDEQLSFLRNYTQYVDRDGDQFQIRESIQQRVDFQHHDLINDDPKSDFDLVMCRNLFIYIDNEYKEPILRTIAESLRSGGFLVIGKAETIPPRLQSAFTVVDGRLRIYRRE
jgi:chemotaxis protein methyltransferase CheR